MVDRNVLSSVSLRQANGFTRYRERLEIVYWERFDKNGVSRGFLSAGGISQRDYERSKGIFAT